MFSLLMVISTCSASNVFDNSYIAPDPGWTDQTGDVVLTRAFVVGSQGNCGICASAVIPNYNLDNIIERGFRCVRPVTDFGYEMTYELNEYADFGEMIGIYDSGDWIVSAYIITADEEIHYSNTITVTIP